MQISHFRYENLNHESTSDSPLWMVTKEPILNELVMRLQRLRLMLLDDPTGSYDVRFSRTHLEQVRLSFAHMILQGERELHRLSQLICHSLVSSFILRSVVFGEIEATGERFTITKDISADELYATIDIDLGNRQLNKLRFRVGDDQWSQATLLANVVDYQPSEPNEYRIHRIISRIKAEEEIWNKVVDEIFDLDGIVVRDKQLKHYSRYVKDIFGIKIVVGEQEDAYRVQQTLVNLNWGDDKLKELHIKPAQNRGNLEFVEVKDYLKGKRKQSGWEAIKSVVRWSDKTFEIQIQPLRNFLRERELLTKESHTSFKSNRERVREQVAQKVPLFGFYRDLLRWLFLNPDDPPPQYNGIKLLIVD